MRHPVIALALLGGLAVGVASAKPAPTPPPPPEPVAAPAPAAPAAAPAAISGDPQKVADYRHNAFEGLGKHMKVSSMMVKGEIAPTQADMVLHARAMNDTAKAIGGWFPAGTGPTDVSKTDALPAIWSDRSGFEARLADFDKASMELLKKAEANDVEGFKAAFGAVGKSCGGCHDGYRLDNDN